MNKPIQISKIRQEIIDRHEAFSSNKNVDILFLGHPRSDDLDQAIIGSTEQNGVVRVIYSQERILDILMARNRMDYEKALEYFESNILNVDHGEQTPIYMSVLDHVLQAMPALNIESEPVNNLGLKSKACPCTRQPGIPGAVPRL
jgi:hypothetical protein